VEVTGSDFVEVVLQGAKKIVHLINAAGQMENTRYFIFDEIPPIGPLKVVLRIDHEPVTVTLEPGASEVSWRYEDGAVYVEMPSVDIHRMVVAQ
jgi:hypothetical protein